MDAAEAAGYATPRVDGWRLLRNTAVKAAIRHARDVRVPEIENACIEVCLEIARDKGQAAAARLQATDRLREIRTELLGTGAADNPDGARSAKSGQPNSDRVANILMHFTQNAGNPVQQPAPSVTIDMQPTDNAT